MPRSTLLVALLGAVLGCSSDRTTRTPSPGPGPDPGLQEIWAKAARPQLTRFASERELERFFGELAEVYRAQQQRLADSAAEKVTAPEAASPSMGAANESITNTQHAGVDEGGIVKVHGDHLVVLRRGRLFTVAIGDDALTPVAHADAFGPGIDPGGAWYDEMLVSGDTAIVIGYSYQRGGTEVGLFDLGRDGSITYRATYHLRSNDYYSSRNYASRIVDGKLVFYSPMYLSPWSASSLQTTLPSVRRWHPGATEQEFQRILAPTDIYRPLAGFSAEALHTVTVCDLAARDLTCKASAVMGPAGRTFYVSDSAVYVWASSWEGKPRSMVVRMPLDGGAPGVLQTRGGPIDQFSFLERDAHLHVLVRSESTGDAMWGAEVTTTTGDMAMLRVPVRLFSDQALAVPEAFYARLPLHNPRYMVQNRFVGDHLLYGADGRTASKTSLYVVPIEGGAATPIVLQHGIDRIEALGRDAVIVGGDGTDLHFTTISLGQRAIAGSYIRRGAAQGEARSHGFFYKPDADGTGGVLGLPVLSAEPGAAHLREGSASITFVRERGLSLAPLGELEAGRDVGLADGCRASCVDWYGNARPIFVRGRILALLGYELVEGTLGADKLVERRRVSFAPDVRVVR